MNLEIASTEDCACTQITENSQPHLEYPSQEYFADFGILAGTIIIYSIAKKVYDGLKKITE